MHLGALSCGLHISEGRSIIHEQSGYLAWPICIYLTHDDASMYAGICVAILGLQIRESISGFLILDVLHSCRTILVPLLVGMSPINLIGHRYEMALVGGSS